MAYGVYFVPATMVAQQIGLGMTSMLTLIAYMLALSGSLPRISYLTRADRFFVDAALLVFLGLVKAVITSALGRGQDTPATLRTNWGGRMLYPIGMILTLVLALGA